MPIKKIISLTTFIKPLLCLFIIISTPLSANNISIERMTSDITYLASDKLKGRANFSPEIELAAEFISQRFYEIGLEPYKDTNLFKQTFNVINNKIDKVKATINHQNISSKSIFIATSMKSFSWQNLKKINTHFIGKNDNFREILRTANSQGGQHLILVNKIHKKIFSRYQSYLNSGVTKLKLKNNTSNQNAIVAVLTDEKNITALNIKVTTNITEKKLSNVVAVLPGKSKANEIVMFSAHYDHLGATPSGDEIFNGADDNASGTTAIINLAQHYAKQNNNERTIMFAAFSGEEIGGYGSQYLSQQLDPNSVIAMLNIEMIGKPSKFGTGTLWMTGMERSNLGILLNKALEAHNLKIFKDPYPEQGLFYRSDNATLARLGVPAHTFSSTQLDKDIHYHKTSDDINSLDLKSMHNAIETLSIASQNLINGKVTPTRIDTTKVKSKGKIF